MVTVASEAARDGTALKVENRLDARFDVTLGAMMGRDEESIERPIVREGIAGRGTAKDAVLSSGEEVSLLVESFD